MFTVENQDTMYIRILEIEPMFGPFLLGRAAVLRMRVRHMFRNELLSRFVASLRRAACPYVRVKLSDPATWLTSTSTVEFVLFATP